MQRFDSGITDSETVSLVCLCRLWAIDPKMVSVARMAEQFQSPRARLLAEAIRTGIEPESEADRAAFVLIRAVSVVPMTDD